MNENKYGIKKLIDAYNRLKEGALKANDELTKDGVIQRFEFTFELLWKVLKLILFSEGIECYSPKSCLKEAFKLGIIVDEKIALNMLADRNRSSHIYEKDMANEIFDRIKNIYVNEIGKYINNLKKYC